MNLHRFFDDKHDRRIAQNILESLDDGAQGFYKSTGGDYLRVSERGTAPPLTVVYGGAAKGIINTLIVRGMISVGNTPAPIPNGQGRGYRLEKA